MRQVVIIAAFLSMSIGLFSQNQPKDSTSLGTSQRSASRPHPEERCGLKKLDQCLKDLAHDQAGIWTSPLRVNSHDAIWLVPFAGATGAAFAYDSARRTRVSSIRAKRYRSLVLPTRRSAKPERYIFWVPLSTTNICGKPASSEPRPSPMLRSWLRA